MEELIKKYPVKANLEDYEEAYRCFDLESVKRDFTWLAGGKINAAFEAVDRHASSWRRNKIALFWENNDGEQRRYTFREMKILTCKIANVLKSHGVKKGDRVFLFLPRIPELYFSVLAIARMGAISGPLFAAFGPEAVKDRVGDSEAGIVITTPELKGRVEKVKDELPALKEILVVGEGFENEVSRASKKFEPVPLELEDPLIIHYTSGTTGKPKGVVHANRALLSHYITTRWILDLRDEDIYWCTADPGWVTGTSYGIYGPWLNGATQLVLEGRFNAEKWYQMIEDYQVTVWYTAPTALRLLMKAGDELARKYNLKSLRHICSVGEPLNPEVVRWGMKVYGLPIHDNWWQTETGSIMIANYPCMPVKPGSMGKPFPGIQAAIIDEQGRELPAGEIGNLMLRPGWPSQMAEIWKNPEKYQEYFKVEGWYLSGDTAYQDEDGYFWFVGRADDIINTAGHRVGPFEVESALVEHPAVAEAGVIGKPDVERGEIIKAFITLRDGYQPSEELKEDIRKFIKTHLAGHAYPREIEFRDSLPKTRSGKIMRRVLKAWELGLPTGDTSTLED